eukprot:5278338-Alexandrium_andersonii.AAC.1
MTAALRWAGGSSRSRARTAARQAHASASCPRQCRGMTTVTQPTSDLSPTASGLDQTTAAPPPTEC